MPKKKKSREKKETEEEKKAEAEKVTEKKPEKEITEEAKENEEEELGEPKLLEEPIAVKELLLMYILSLEGKAWAYLDLIVHPETQKHKKDINEAKLAIDSIDALYKIVENQLSPEDKNDIQVRLTNLRLNFVKE